MICFWIDNHLSESTKQLIMNYFEMEVVRSTEIRSSIRVGKIAQIPSKAYKKPQVSGLKQCIFGGIVPFEIPKPGILSKSIHLTVSG